MGAVSKCSKKELEYAKQYRAANKHKKSYRDKANARAKKHYADNREAKRKYQREYGKQNAVALRSKRNERYKNNKEKESVYRHNRRARVHKVGGSFTKSDIENLYSIQGARCYYCSRSIEEGYHIDHMTPIIRGGSNDVSNLCLTDPECNRRKHTKTAEEFLNG